MCSLWAEWFELDFTSDRRGLDPGLARVGLEALRMLPQTAERQVLLATDLHAGNILSSARGWLAIDPKPFIGDPAFDPVQHMLNCDERLERDPAGLAERMAELTGTDPERVRLWLFARCAEGALRDLPAREVARRLAP
jgi:streptomycin 6-kinase